MKIAAITVLIGSFAIALPIGTAQAQNMGGMGGGFGGRHGQHQKKSKSEPAKPKVDEKAYDAALKELPDKQYDAWHDVR